MIKKKAEKKHNKILIILLLIFSILFIYSKYIEPKELVVNEYKIENSKIPKSFNGLKIVHFSDLHFGSTIDINNLKKLIKLINRQKPDLVLFTGDLINKQTLLTESDINNIKKEFNKINSTLGNYAVNGNHDINKNDYFTKILEENFTILNNNEKLIYYNGSTPISLLGFSDASKTTVDYSILNQDNDYYKIVMAHEPDEFDKLKNKNINLMLSGHSHNGQIRIPFIGKIYTPIGSKTYYDTYYNINNIDFYISNGIGCSEINVRFLSKPSINLYRLYSE